MTLCYFFLKSIVTKVAKERGQNKTGDERVTNGKKAKSLCLPVGLLIYLSGTSRRLSADAAPLNCG